MNKPKVILDSGAYTAYKQGITINIDEYAKFVIEHGHEFVGCFNLDSINDSKKSYENWKYLTDCGAKTIPIYHMTTGEEQYLKKYLKQADYIGLGAIANMDTSQRRKGLDRIWKEYLTDSNGKPIVKVHGLGITDIELMDMYPWYSVDSFTPVISAVWGSVLLPLIRDDRFQYLNMNICRISDQGKHTKGLAGSFANYPKSLQKQYVSLFEEYGFQLGEVLYQEKRLTRKDKRLGLENKKVPQLWNLTQPSDTNVRTLANHWEERMRWNLTMWGQIQKLLPNLLMFMGVSTKTHLSIFGLVKPKLDILISYYYLKGSIYEAIKNYIQ